MEPAASSNDRSRPMAYFSSSTRPPRIKRLENRNGSFEEEANRPRRRGRQNPRPHRFYSNLIPGDSQIFKRDANVAARRADAGGRARRDARSFRRGGQPVGLTRRPDDASAWWRSKIVRFCGKSFGK